MNGLLDRGTAVHISAVSAPPAPAATRRPMPRIGDVDHRAHVPSYLVVAHVSAARRTRLRTEQKATLFIGRSTRNRMTGWSALQRHPG